MIMRRYTPRTRAAANSDPPAGLLQRRNRLQRAIERDAVLVEQSRVAQPPHPIGAVVAWRQERHGTDDAIELGFTARVGVGIALDQPACVGPLDGDVVVLRGVSGGEGD